MRVRLRDLDGSVFEFGVSGGTWSEAGSGELLDLTALYSVPGLADAHIHLSADSMVLEQTDLARARQRAFMAVRSGVFLGLDKGWCDEVVLSILSDPLEVRPDLQAAGRMIATPGGYFPDFTEEVDDDGLVAAVRAAAARTAGWVKIVGDWPRKGRGALANFGEEALAAAVRVAHDAGARVAIHTMAPEVPSAAVRAGVDSIEHGLFLTEDDITSLGARGGAWVPTLVNMQAVIDQIGPESSGGRLLTEGLGRVRSLLPAAGSRGVAVLAGSDLAFPHGKIGLEVMRLIEFGMSPGDAVAAASSRAYEYAGVMAGFEAGRPADLVAFEADPRDDPSTLLEPHTVIRAGTPVPPS